VHDAGGRADELGVAQDPLSLGVNALRFLARQRQITDAAISADEAAALQVKLDQGFDEVPEALRGIGGVVLEPARAWGFSFLYSQFVPFNADIDVSVQRHARKWVRYLLRTTKAGSISSLCLVHRLRAHLGQSSSTR